MQKKIPPEQKEKPKSTKTIFLNIKNHYFFSSVSNHHNHQSLCQGTIDQPGLEPTICSPLLFK